MWVTRLKKMIKKLKIKFILLAMTTLLLLLAAILTGMNMINYNSVVSEADEILSVLSQNRGTFPELGGRPSGKLPPHMSPETPYESRFFSVLTDRDGNIISTDTGRISAVDVSLAADYATAVLEGGRDRGFTDRYRYAVRPEGEGSRITFLDWGRSLDAFRGFLYTSIAMAAAGFLIAFIIIFVLSGKIIKPIAEANQKQRRFITDAGHEIKTPLTIISANADILEMELSEPNESLSDIKGQVARLKTLTDDLVLLSRMEESQDSLAKIDFPLSEVAEAAAHPFAALAERQGKRLSVSVTPLITLSGNDKAAVKLVNILLDNALKYSPSDSEITFSLAKSGRSALLSVSNKMLSPIADEQLDRIFDRFYRTDASRNSEMGGHGIGLSVAYAIVAAHGGKIYADMPEEDTFRITVSLPL